MKRYLAFYGDHCYPSGGMGDFIGDYDTKEEAIKDINEAHKKNGYNELEWNNSWAHIWDIHTGIEVYNK